MNQLVKIGRSEIRPSGLGRVLVVHRDPTMRDMIMRCLAEDQCMAVGSSGDDLGHQLRRNQFSLLTLDLGAGPLDGFDMLRHVRALSDVPVILTTGKPGSGIDKIVGLELGADDLIPTPFDPRELIARARAILRRQELGRGSAAEPIQRGYRFLGWELQRRTRALTDPAGREVELTKADYALLVAFLEAARRPLSREQLIQATRAHEDIYDRSIDVRVMRLRRKLNDEPGQPRLVRTLRGLGYMLDARVETLF